jgi:hypothetical protein
MIVYNENFNIKDAGNPKNIAGFATGYKKRWTITQADSVLSSWGFSRTGK